MANNETGQDVVDDLAAPFKKFSDFVDKINTWGDKVTGGKKDVMKDIPDDNPNKKAWEDATKFQGPTQKTDTKAAPLVNKTLGTAKKAAKTAAAQNKATKRQ